jgi:hypothetical protein
MAMGRLIPALTFACLTLVVARLNAQTGQGEIPPTTRAMLQLLQAELLFPLDSGYRVAPETHRDFFPCHYRLSSRAEGIEIRFFLQPDVSQEIPPQLESRRLALHLCSNDENAVITARPLDDVELAALFGADWGQVHLFPPKQAFGNGLPYCQMASIYKKGRGMIHIFTLFAEPSVIVENRLYLARFQ